MDSDKKMVKLFSSVTYLILFPNADRKKNLPKCPYFFRY